MSGPATFVEDVREQPLQAQLEAFLDEHRAALTACLDGLTEAEARRSLVSSRTTLLGLVKHAASRGATATLGLDDVVRGDRRGPLPLRRVYVHTLRELAQH